MIERLSVLRLDGDVYKSTMDAPSALWIEVSIGGYVIVDDFLSLPACKAAVEDLCNTHGSTDSIKPIVESGVFWERFL